jgi:hypothetical protein
MFTFVLLAVLWVVVGTPVVARHLHERRALPMEEFQRAINALQTPGPLPGGPVGPTQASIDAAARRRTISALVYGSACVLAAVGAITSDTGTLTAAVIVGNLGTGHRLLAMRLDRAHRRTRARRSTPVVPYVLPPAPRGAEPLGEATSDGPVVVLGEGRPLPSTHLASTPPFEPRIDEVTGDGQTWGDGWQIIRPEPLGVDDLVLVDADVS